MNEANISYFDSLTGVPVKIKDFTVPVAGSEESVINKIRRDWAARLLQVRANIYNPEQPPMI